MRLFLLALIVPLAAAAQAPPDSALAALAPFVGAPWQSSFEADGEIVTDISRFEWAMNGRVLRNIHANTAGTYGGETLFWAEGDSLRFLYVTSGGFTTSGTATVGADGTLTAVEVVEGHPEIDRVRSVSHVRGDGRLHTVSEYRRGGAWTPGREGVYERTPDARLPPGFAPGCDG